MKTLPPLLFFAILSFAFEPIAMADTSPDGVTREMIANVQRSRNVGAALSYVHWQTAFADLTAQERASAHVRTPAELQARCRNILADPAAAIQSQLQAQFGDAGGLDALSAVTGSVAQGLAAEVDNFKHRAVTARYQVGTPTIMGDNATVPVTVSSDGETRQEKIPFRKIAGSWYIPSLRAIDRDGYIRDALTGRLVQRLGSTLNFGRWAPNILPD